MAGHTTCPRTCSSGAGRARMRIWGAAGGGSHAHSPFPIFILFYIMRLHEHAFAHHVRLLVCVRVWCRAVPYGIAQALRRGVWLCGLVVVDRRLVIRLSFFFPPRVGRWALFFFFHTSSSKGLAPSSGVGSGLVSGAACPGGPVLSIPFTLWAAVRLLRAVIGAGRGCSCLCVMASSYKIYLFCLVGGCCWPGTLGAQGPPHSLAGTAAARKARSCRSAASMQSRSHGKTWPRKPRKRGRRRCGCGLHGRRGPQWGGPWRGSVR